MGPFQQFFWKKKLIKNLVCSKLSMLCLIYTVMNLWCSYSVFFFSCSVVVDWISGCFEFVGGKGDGSYLKLLRWKRVSFCSAFFFLVDWYLTRVLILLLLDNFCLVKLHVWSSTVDICFHIVFFTFKKCLDLILIISKLFHKSSNGWKIMTLSKSKYAV